jgi:hypothetical protein
LESDRSGPVDKGRFDVTKDPDDLYVFRVASLRNVAMTQPYFHDGSVATLPVFRKGKHDDQADSTTQMLDWFKRGGQKPQRTDVAYL